VAWMVNLMKTSRSTVSPFKGDHYADGAGYMACGYHCTVEEVDRNWAAEQLHEAGLDGQAVEPLWTSNLGRGYEEHRSPKRVVDGPQA